MPLQMYDGAIKEGLGRIKSGCGYYLSVIDDALADHLIDQDGYDGRARLRLAGKLRGRSARCVNLVKQQR